MHRIDVIDSHTAGEPTRVVVAGGPDLRTGPLPERLEQFRKSFDHFRTAIIMEPRGSDVLVGALLCPPTNSACAAAVIFFNNVGYLGMCGHGMMGVVATLAHLHRLAPGRHRFETVVGTVDSTLHADGTVSIENVVAFRRDRGVVIDVPGHGRVTGHIAWGGNWFFLAQLQTPELELKHVDQLSNLAQVIRQAINAQGFPEVDHIEICRDSTRGLHGRNFVLCPGGEYDRSPCGTGTSAHLACLAADGRLAEGAIWTQEGILGTTFSGSYRWQDQTTGTIIPTITGRAWVTAESTLLLNEEDPFRWGIG